jgi:hypothetical protein
MAAGGEEFRGGDQLERARALFAERGPICDSEGFYQHTGECWNDELQMILLFGDSLKEQVQPFVMYLDTSEENIGKLYPTFTSVERKYIIQYLLATQKRFARHYLAEHEKRNTCPLNEQGGRAQRALLQISKNARFRAQGIQGIGAAAAGKKQIPNSTYVIGGNVDDERFVLSLFNPAFLPNRLQKYTYDSVEGIYPLTGFDTDLPSSPSTARYGYREENGISLSVITSAESSIGHALCFYTCGGNDYFYEDTFGPFMFPWRQFMSLIPTAPLPAGESLSIHFSAKCQIKRTGTSDVFITNWYPVLVHKVGEVIHLRTLTYGSPGVVSLTLNETYVSDPSTGFQFSILMTKPSLTTNKLRMFTTLTIQGSDVKVATPDSHVFGSRIFSLKNAFKSADANAFNVAFTPELAQELMTKLMAQPSFSNISVNFLPNKNPESEKIILKLFDFFPDNYIHILHRIAIENDYKNLLDQLYSSGKTSRDKLIRKQLPLLTAIRQDTPNVIEVLCREPLSQKLFEQAQTEVQDSTEDVQTKFNTFCRAAGAGGGKRKLYRKSRRVNKRKACKTKKAIRK